jgi:predicted acyltransferase
MSSPAGTAEVFAPRPLSAPSPRLLSLDVFRGFNILIMIVVNCCGPGSFTELQHSAWNGCTLTDLVFPFFLFISGVSIPFSSRLHRSVSGPVRDRLRLLPTILQRAALIFAIGLLINGFPYYHPATWRIPGVLQRIALCYLAASVLYLFSNARTRWAVIAALLVGYWILMRYVPVPGFGIPTVNIPLLDPSRNLASWLDRRLMMGHLYRSLRDPEGVLSTLPAIASTLFGVAAGEWIRRFRMDTSRLLRRLVALGVACTAAGLLWAQVFPINKKLWTSSYVLFTAGLALLTLAVCYWLLDVRQLRGRWTVVPVVFGTNCIFAYSLSEFFGVWLVVHKLRIGGRLMDYQAAFNYFTFDHIPWTQWSSLSYALFYTAFCWAVTGLLYRRKIFLKV